MLNVSNPKANRLNIELSGVLDADDMQAALDDVVRESKSFTNGTMLYTISDFGMPTLGAMAVEFYRMPKLFSLLERFDKCAVLCDTAWIRTAAQIEGAIIPSLAIKSFALSDVAAAEAWLESSADADDDEDDFENFPV